MEAHGGAGDDFLRKELKACRLQLQQTKRRAAAAQEAKDALGVKLDAARDEVAELERRLDTHQIEILTGEVSSKLAALAKAEKYHCEMETSLNLIRMENAKIKERLQVAETDGAGQVRSAGQLEEALIREKEHHAKLEKSIDTLTSQYTALKTQNGALKETVAAMKREDEVKGVQIRAQETALVTTEAALRQARREAEEAGRVKQTSRELHKESQKLHKELTHLGIELLREQDAAAAASEAQQAIRAAARSHRSGEGRHLPQRDIGVNNAAGTELPSLDSFSSSSSSSDTEKKVASLQRRLIAEKECSAKTAAALHEREEEIKKLERSLELRSEGDTLRQEVLRMRTLLNSKTKEHHAALAEIAALREELAAAEKKDRLRQQGKENTQDGKREAESPGPGFSEVVQQGGFVSPNAGKSPGVGAAALLTTPAKPKPMKGATGEQKDLQLSPIVQKLS